jgi:Dehydrogenase E1 component
VGQGHVCWTFSCKEILSDAYGIAGQFYECLNMASLYKLPCIFVVENNKWAIGMQHLRATGPSAGDFEPFIYKKGPAFGMPGVLVDGMDVLKVSFMEPCFHLFLYLFADGMDILKVRLMVP